LGPVLALVVFFVLPDSYPGTGGDQVEFSYAGRATLGAMAWMAVWWLTEAIDISATALLPLAVFPTFGITSMRDAASPYAHPLIFLFMGGFLLALSMQRWQLDRRIALLTLSYVGTRPTRMIGGFMLVTAVLSGFVSNTATTAMMLPIALSVIALLSSDGSTDDAATEDHANFATCLMLGIAYSASIGGIVTIVGTPPNVFFVSFVRNTIAEPYRVDITFARWLLIGIPLALIFLPIVWLLLTRVLFPIRFQRIEGGDQLISEQLKRLGKPGRGETVTLIVFVVTALMWIFRPLLLQISWERNGATVTPLANLTDAGIVMSTALTLFVIPVRHQERTHVMQWSEARKLPWGILVLFGGGLSLASAVEANGVASFLGSQSVYISGLPPILLVLVVTTAIVFMTELTSNIATTATVLPVLAALAPGLGVHPFTLIVPAAIAASCAFMLPVATPPNAIVFASGKITIPQMARTGFWLNLAGIVVVTLLTKTLVGPVFGMPSP
jgi:sodium-dependent dicarboxylate transporter 2/3/5